MKKHDRRRQVINRIKVLSLLLLCTVLFSACGDEDNPYNFIGREPKEIDPWVYIQYTKLSESVQILDFASSAGNLAITVGVMGIVFSILYMALRILFAGNAKARSEVKEEAVLKGLIAVMIFSLPLWLGLCKMVSEMLI